MAPGRPPTHRRVGRALGVGLALASVVAVTSGCGAFREDFEPRGEKATAARDGVPTTLDAALATATDGLEPLGRAGHDECGEGQDNWKVQSEYAWDCVAVASSVAPAAVERSEVGDALEAADERASDLGCRPVSERSGLQTTLREYWTPEADNGKDPGDLPEGRYTCDDGLTLLVEPVSATGLGDLTVSAKVTAGGGGATEVVSDEPFPAEVEQQVRGSGAADTAMFLLTTVGTTYYSVDW